jgi:phosphoenolpyruvate carboxylase
VAHEPGDNLASVLKKLAEEGIDTAQAAALLDKSLIAVLTAPTEVMREGSTMHPHCRIDARDLGREETLDGDVIEQAILRQIALLWQTRPLRPAFACGR